MDSIVRNDLPHHNGLVAAACLAKAGKKVLVLERKAWPGGGVVTRQLNTPHDPGQPDDYSGRARALLMTWIDRNNWSVRQGWHYFYDRGITRRAR